MKAHRLDHVLVEFSLEYGKRRGVDGYGHGARTRLLAPDEFVDQTNAARRQLNSS